jgi:hypothetical protein
VRPLSLQQLGKDFLPDIRIGTAPILGTMLGRKHSRALEAVQQRPMVLHQYRRYVGQIRAYFGDGYYQ